MWFQLLCILIASWAMNLTDMMPCRMSPSGCSIVKDKDLNLMPVGIVGAHKDSFGLWMPVVF